MSQVIHGKGLYGKQQLTIHAWNENKTQLALSTDLGKLDIFDVSGNNLKLVHSMEEHTGRITGIDWCHATNQIATCSADRNAFVWVLEGGEWRHTLVLLRVNRACTSIQWSPKGDKFAVGTGSRVIAVCYFDKSNNFWVAKHVKKPIRSTITCIDWHPNNMLLVAGGTDFKVRVFSAFISEMDKKPSEPTVWGAMKPFGAMLAESDAEGWVHSVTFNQSGEKVAAVSHGSMITVILSNAGGEPHTVNTPWSKLPFKVVRWLSDSRIVCGGFDFVPEVFNVAGDGTACHAGSLDKLTGAAAAAPARAKEMFQHLDKRGGGDGSGDSGNTAIRSVHKNTIMHIQYHSGSKNNADKISTCGLDGQVVLWDVKSLSAAFAQMKV